MGNRSTYERVPTWYDPDTQPGDVANPDPEPEPVPPTRLDRWGDWLEQKARAWAERRAVRKDLRILRENHQEELRRLRRRGELWKDPRTGEYYRAQEVRDPGNRVHYQWVPCHPYRRDVQTGRYYLIATVVQPTGGTRLQWVEVKPPDPRWNPVSL